MNDIIIRNNSNIRYMISGVSKIIYYMAKPANEKIKLTAEQRLVLEIFSLARKDIIKLFNNINLNEIVLTEARKAYNYLTEENYGFNYYCNALGLEPSAIRELYKKEFSLYGIFKENEKIIVDTSLADKRFLVKKGEK